MLDDYLETELAGKVGATAERLIELSVNDDLEPFRALWENLTIFEQRVIAIGIARMVATERAGA